MMEPNLPMENKPPLAQHPYQNFVKRIFANKLKYSHNSIYANPVYPVKLPKRIPRERFKFTVFGIRSHPEFNYCVQVVEGLHRYRTYLFEAPDIQAVTPVDWPKAWTDLKVRFGGITDCIQNPVVILINGNLLGGTQEFEDYIKTRYHYYLCLNYYNLAVESFIRFVRSSGLPHAYMHIAINDEVIGTFIFRLFSDLVPSTCDNFLRLCNATRGGYGGTPIHRIVKDNWIQCGGYGLKSNPGLDCENFVVPHDKRGVLGMANDGRNCDCSTQFFILLQPSPWMACKYVAFGQLIDGEETLKKIENVPTFYESPLSKVVIAKAGILNLEATDIVVSPGTNEYIQSHIEDLVILGAVALGWLLQKVDLQIEMIEILKLRALGEGQEVVEEGTVAGIRNAERFMKKKGDLGVVEREMREEHLFDEGAPNVDFDVEEYEYVFEEEVIYKQMTPSGSMDEMPQRLYYIPLTDVPYPEEKDSTYDLKKFLKGDYCLESDLQPSTVQRKKGIRFEPGPRYDEEEESPEESTELSVKTLDSDDASEIRRYLRAHSDHVSFAGGVITGIAKGEKEYFTIYDAARKAREKRAKRDTKVSINVSASECPKQKIKRSQTGYAVLSPTEIEGMTASEIDKLKFGVRENSDTQGRHVRIVDSTGHSSDSTVESLVDLKPRLMAGPGDVDSDERIAVMKRLYRQVTRSGDDVVAPTLKNYRPIPSGRREKSTLLTNSQTLFHREESIKSRVHHASYTKDQMSMEQMLTLQHGKKFARKISSDYVKSIDQFEHPVAISLRTLEYAQQRPSMSVAEYQLRNELYEKNLRRAAEEATLAAKTAAAEALKVTLETKMEPPEMFTATSQSSAREEARAYEEGEEYDDERQYISSMRRTEVTTRTSTYEREIKTEEYKTVKTFMVPPQEFRYAPRGVPMATKTKSEASTNIYDGTSTPILEPDDSPNESLSSSKAQN